MMKKKKLILAVFAIVTAVACSGVVSESVPPVGLKDQSDAEDLLKRNELARDRLRFSTEPAREFDVESYDLTGRFDWATRLLRAALAITLDRKPGLATLELDSNVERVTRVRLAGGKELAFSVDGGGGLLKIDLPADLTATRLELLIDYEAMGGLASDQTHRNLTVIPARKGDPVQSPVVFTHSEPRGARAWMPCNDRPADRALFHTRFTMSEEERLIANGRLVNDSVSGGVRTVEHRTEHPLPTYLMAFAQGDFVSAQRQHGSLPIAVWARRGVSVDFQGVLDETDRQLTTYERLLVPYPFEKYAVVLIPEFGGGMEHASITFNDEQSSSQRLAGDLSLMGHELGHQWFGDLVTVKTWDDLWIKEGMATLLSAESSRPYEDLFNTGTLMGQNFAAVSGDAMRDSNDAPEDKYHTGPYGRSAWFLTQLRALIGEDAFWGHLRHILTAHAYGAISSEEFLAEFEPSLSPELYKKALKAIEAHEMPSLAPEWKDGVLKLSLTDKEGALLAPYEILEKSADGGEKHLLLTAGGSVELKKSPGKLIALDPNEAHSRLAFWLRDEKGEIQRALREGLNALQTPSTPDELQVFKTLPAATQKRAITESPSWRITAAQFADLRDGLGSASGRFAALNLACRLAKNAASSSLAPTPSAEKDTWQAILEESFANPPMLGASAHVSLHDCQGALPASTTARLHLIATHPDSPFLNDLEIFFLERLPLENGFATWSPLVLQGASLRARLLPVTDLAMSSKPDLPDAGSRKAFFRKLLSESEVTGMQSAAVEALGRLEDTDSLPLLATVVKNPTTSRRLPPVAICTAWKLAKNRGDLWTDFANRIIPLRKDLEKLVKDPEKECPKATPYKRPS